MCRTVFKSQAGDEADQVSHRTLPGDLPWVRADANKITWVLTNLISNALAIREQGRSYPNYGQKDRPACPSVRARRRAGDSPGISIEDLSEVRSGEGARSGRHGSGACHLQGDRARSWRRDLGGIIRRSGQHLYLHPAGGPIGGTHGKETDSRSWTMKKTSV